MKQRSNWWTEQLNINSISYTKRHPQKEDTKAEKSGSHWKLKDQNLERTLGNHGGDYKADLSDYRLRVITGLLRSACF